MNIKIVMVWNISLKELILWICSKAVGRIPIVWNISLKELIRDRANASGLRWGCLKYILKGIDTNYYCYNKSTIFYSLKYILKGIDTKLYEFTVGFSSTVWNISLKELIRSIKYGSILTIVMFEIYP